MLDPQALASFPAGFSELLQTVLNGEPLDREFDHVWQGSDSPHLAYPLRAIADVQFRLVDGAGGEKVGEIQHEKAIREAHPGATYLHFGRAYRVMDWCTDSYERSILLRRVRHAPRTTALLTTHVSVSTARGEVLDDRLLKGGGGVLAEIRLKVADSVVGYRIGSSPHLYSELSKKDRRMRRKWREFNTTGVFLQLSNGMFAGDSPAAVASRLALADALSAVAAREFGIAPAEIRSAHINIAECGKCGARTRLNDAIVIFDNASGSLRLTRRLFDQFGSVIERLQKGVAAAADEAALDERQVAALVGWHAELAAAQAMDLPEVSVGDHEYLVYAPGSLVGVRVKGELVERRLLEPQFVAVGDSDLMMYQYESSPGARAFAPPERIEPIGDDFRLVIWSPASNTFREISE